MRALNNINFESPPLQHLGVNLLLSFHRPRKNIQSYTFMLNIIYLWLGIYTQLNAVKKALFLPFEDADAYGDIDF